MPLHHEVNASIFQLLHTLVREVVVNRPSEDQQLLLNRRISLFDIEEINRCLHLDILVVDDLLDEMGVALFRQGLESVSEISVIEIIADGNTG